MTDIEKVREILTEMVQAPEGNITNNFMEGFHACKKVMALSAQEALTLLPAAPVKHGDVAEAVRTARENAVLLWDRAQAGRTKGAYTDFERVFRDLERTLQTITAAQQRPEVVTVEELVEIMAERLSDGYHDDAVFYSKRFPHGLIIKSGEG